MFFNTALHCIAVWFDNEDPTEIVEMIESFVLKGGMYGTQENRIMVNQNKQGGKIKYFLSRIFIPYDTLKYKYTVLRKHKVLLPFMWVVRWFSLFSPQKRKRTHRELVIHKNISETTETVTDRMLKILKI